MVWGTPLGYEMRVSLDNWNTILLREQKNRQIKLFLEGQNFVLFFEFSKDIYATTEPHRVTFAKLKDPDEESPIEWCQEAHWTAFNLSKAILGRPAQEIFDYSDTDKIDVISKDDAYDKLVKIAEEASPEKMMSGTQAIFKALAGMQSKMNKPDIPLNQTKKP